MAKKAAKKTQTPKAPSGPTRSKESAKSFARGREELVKAWFAAFEVWREARRDYQFALDDLEGEGLTTLRGR